MRSPTTTTIASAHAKSGPQAREERQQAREQVREERSNNSVERQANVRPERPSARPSSHTAAGRSAGAGRAVQWRPRGAARLGRHGFASSALDSASRPSSSCATIAGLRQWARRSARTRTPRAGGQQRAASRHAAAAARRKSARVAAPQWSTNWRNNSQYDWQNHRRHHRSWFHLGFYYDPFGWGYNPYQIGWRLWPSYYSSNYWINDPWQYRLPYAPPGTRWVRYYDDAILVDMWSGQVVDVIYNFFW